MRARDFQRVGTTVVDLSPDGMRVLADADVEVGDELVVAFRAPVTEAWIECAAWVAHVADDDTFGVVFDLDQEMRETLEISLSRVPPVIPRRASGTYSRMVVAAE